MLGIIVFLGLVGAVFSFAILGWVWWARKAGGVEVPRWRSALGLLSLSVLSLQILVFCLFEAYGFLTGSFSYRSEQLFLWGRVDLYLGLGVIVFAVFGKGRFRAPVVASTVALEIVWFLLGTGV